MFGDGRVGASKLYGVNATIIILLFVFYCILLYFICILLYFIVFYCILLYCILLYCILLLINLEFN